MARPARLSARWPDLEELTRQRTTRVVLAAAHLDHDPANNRLRNQNNGITRTRRKPARSYYHIVRRQTGSGL